MAFRSLLTLSLAVGLAAANPCYPGGTSTTETASVTSTVASSSSETASTAATITTVSSETATATSSASTSSSAAPDTDCYKGIKVLKDVVIGGIPAYNNGNAVSQEACLDACANSDTCVAFAFMGSGGVGTCWVAYDDQGLWGPVDAYGYITGYSNTC
ncbi:hypothetical protein ACHAPT_011202 [Fusarium lateritium]